MLSFCCYYATSAVPMVSARGRRVLLRCGCVFPPWCRWTAEWVAPMITALFHCKFQRLAVVAAGCSLAMVPERASHKTQWSQRQFNVHGWPFVPATCARSHASHRAVLWPAALGHRIPVGAGEWLHGQPCVTVITAQQTCSPVLHSFLISLLPRSEFV